ncbi:MAG: UvrD-helicase domain-containing protein [Bacilli bacterium]|nr:UvrD-helicase domain-containing protein [Bacilli bacterium]
MDLDNLNERQLEAVKCTEGPLLVLAGAGSGKTKVLTTRVAYLVNECGISPNNILAITFTNKAAKEMKDRVFRVLGSMAYNIQISTFHSLGVLFIRENYELLGYKNNFTIIDSDDSLTIIKKIIKDLGYDPKYYNPKMIRNLISGAKNALLTPSEYERYANTEETRIASEVYNRYQNKLYTSNSFDFDDLLMKPIELLRKNPDVLKAYQERFQYILIDEYQDTNEAQYILSKMLSAKHRNICVVGDNDQSIYSFRGSNYKNILNFEKDYKDAKVIMLEENYRSTKNILNVANSVIKNNRERKDKNLWTNNEDGDKVIYHTASNEKEESSYVVSEIKKLINNGVERKDIVVLYRTNAQSRTVEDAFLSNNIPYKVVGSFYFYNRKEIKDLISYLRVIYNHSDDVSLLRVINVPKRGIGTKTIDNLVSEANLTNKSIYDVISSGKELEFKRIIEDIEENMHNLSLTELVDYILDKSGIRHELESEDSVDSEIRLENLEEFKSITKNFEDAYGLASLEDFLAEISLVADIEEHRDDVDTVTLMTIHSAKGLEFDYVFIVGLEEGVFPHSNSIFEGNVEEERRLCYVAITRASKKLWLVNTKERMLYGERRQNEVSRFIKEIDSNYLDTDIEINYNKYENEYTDDEYSIGEHIMHDVYGEGVIVEIKDSIITVAFSHQYGIKSLMKGHKSIKKVIE